MSGRIVMWLIGMESKQICTFNNLNKKFDNIHVSVYFSSNFNDEWGRLYVVQRSDRWVSTNCHSPVWSVTWQFAVSPAPCGAGAPLFPPCPFTSSSFPFFFFFLSFIGFTYFLILSIPSRSPRIVPLRFQAGGRRRRPNLGLVSFFLFFCVCNLCSLYSLVNMHCGVFWFSFVCSFSALTLLVWSFDP